VFAERGFDAATLQEISKRVGLSMGTIYAVFPNKAELLAAILDLRGRALLALAREVVEHSDGALDTLNRLIAAYITYFVAHPTFLQMHLRQGTSWVLTPGDGGNGRAAIWSEIHTLQSEIFRRGVKDGSFVKEDPSFLAKAFSALDQVLLSEWVAGGMKASGDQLVQRLQQLVSRAFSR
jgi:AcrR family transcriptional regulator